MLTIYGTCNATSYDKRFVLIIIIIIIIIIINSVEQSPYLEANSHSVGKKNPVIL